MEARSLLAISIGFNIVLTLLLAITVTENYMLTEKVSNLTSEVKVLRENLNITQTQLEYYRSISRYVEGGEGLGILLASSTVNVVAVRIVESSYEGVVLEVRVDLRVGKGDVYVNTNPRIGIDLQSSVRTAVEVSGRLLGVNVSRYDYVVYVRGEREVDVVDGPSAGLAITLAVISALEGKRLPSGVYMTGTINPDGSVGQVGGVLAKALAAAEHGAKLFLVPPGQSKDTIWEVREERRFIFTIRYLVPRQVDVESYLRSIGYSVRVVEVSSVEQALKLVYNGSY
ncbi:MAG: S16 family serine protease [Candidatus Bathyarchaeia archaeon]